MKKNFAGTFKKDGIESDKILPAQVKKRDQLRIYVKFISLLVLSNILTYLIFIPEQELASLPKVASLSIPAGYVGITIPLKLHAFSSSGVTEVTLLNEKNHTVSKHAFVTEKIENTNSLIDQEQDFYQIYIPQNDLPNIVSNGSSAIRAFPFSQKLIRKPRRRSYEINF